jgi:hypothetical protein
MRMRFSALSIFGLTATAALGPACGDSGADGTASTSSTTEFGTTSTDTSAGESTMPTSEPGTTAGTDGTSGLTTTTTVEPPTTGDTMAVDTTTTTGDTTTTGATTTTGDTTTSGDTTTTDTTTTGDTTTESSTGDGSTTGIGGEANVLYVREDGQNGNPGTIELPLRTIQWAIDKAGQLGTIDTIRVAEGDYAVDYSNDDHIVMIDGVSLYGGYRADWGERDPAQYVTRIVDESAVALPTSESDPHRSIEIPAGVSGSTVLDGFHVGVAHGQHRAALFVAGDATIRNNVIEPLEDVGSVRIVGIRVYFGDPNIVANRFRFAVEQVQKPSLAITAVSSNGLFADNVIDMSGVLGTAYGIYLQGGATKVLGNSIYLQDVGSTYGIWLASNATPVVDNNLIESENLSAICIFSQGGGSVPNAARNNVLDCDYTLRGNDPSRSWTTVLQFEDELANAADNLKLAQTIVGPDDDMVLDTQSPCTVTQGGRDITADVPDDIDGLPRTLPLSIGAHEWDGGCQ